MLGFGEGDKDRDGENGASLMGEIKGGALPVFFFFNFLASRKLNGNKPNSLRFNLFPSIFPKPNPLSFYFSM